MAKVAIKSEKLTPFGGIFSIMEQFDSRLSSVIEAHPTNPVEGRADANPKTMLPNDT